jgi:hypothetical protein
MAFVSGMFRLIDTPAHRYTALCIVHCCVHGASKCSQICLYSYLMSTTKAYSLGHWIDQQPSDGIQSALKFNAGVQFTVLSVIILASTFIPRGSFAFNPDHGFNQETGNNQDAESSQKSEYGQVAGCCELDDLDGHTVNASGASQEPELDKQKRFARKQASSA